jgi:phage terminase small subunit
MAGKQMEGDNVQRRQRGRDARQAGRQPSQAQVTLGASKAPEHLPRAAEHDEKITDRERGKQPRGRTEPKP